MRPVEARYENGVLKPSERLDLRPGERVRVLVLRRLDPDRWDMKRLRGSSDEDVGLASAGLGAWAEAIDDEDAK